MYAFNSHYRTTLFLLVLISLILCLLSLTVQSAENRLAWTANRSLEVADTGLIYSLPVINQKQLTSEIGTLSQQLKQRQEELNRLIEKNHFTVADTFIIAALPGGIIYAAVKKNRLSQAETELNKVTSQLGGLAEFRAPQQHPLQPSMIAAR